jgi:glycosyltransferase involved in cell wall biosynthesis
MKIPVIATSIPAMKQLITNGLNGFLFNSKDFMKLSELLRLMINNIPLRLQMGESAYNAAQDYSLENMIAKHDSYYNDAVGGISHKIK